MKRAVVLVVLSVFVVFALSAQIDSVLSETTNVEFVNETGFDLYHVFFSPADSDYWGPDILDSQTIFGNGESATFLVHHPERCNNFDFMAIDEDGDIYYLWDEEVCDDRNNVITLTLEQYSGESASDINLAQIGITNETSYEMWLLFLSPSDSSYLGVDYLGSSTVMSVGDTISMYVPAGKQEVRYDLIAFDEDGDRYQFQFAVDASRDGTVWPIEMSDLQ